MTVKSPSSGLLAPRRASASLRRICRTGSATATASGNTPRNLDSICDRRLRCSPARRAQSTANAVPCNASAMPSTQAAGRSRARIPARKCHLRRSRAKVTPESGGASRQSQRPAGKILTPSARCHASMSGSASGPVACRPIPSGGSLRALAPSSMRHRDKGGDWRSPQSVAAPSNLPIRTNPCFPSQTQLHRSGGNGSIRDSQEIE